MKKSSDMVEAQYAYKLAKQELAQWKKFLKLAIKRVKQLKNEK